MIVVVSDTSPIRALDFLGQLPVLKVLFDHVLVPTAVRNELDSPLPQFASIDLSRYDFIEVLSPQDDRQVLMFLSTLGRGESEALALALERDAQVILMDEKRGRKVAAQHGFVALDTLGVLLRAKSRGHFTAIRPLMEKLDDLKFFMTPELKNQVLRLAGE